MITVNNKEELIKLVLRTIRNRGFGVNLNFIDTSRITDMSDLFCKIGNLNYRELSIVGLIITCLRAIRYRLERSITGKIDNNIFQIKIDKWDTSNVKDMSYMFHNSSFTGDISKWNVGNVTRMNDMFSGSKFNSDIGNWNVSNVEDMSYMFANSKFNQDISGWDVRKVRDMTRLFSGSMFNRDIGSWNVGNLTYAREMFGEESKFIHSLFIWTTKCSSNINLRKIIPERLLVRLPINLWIEYDNTTRC